jgi:beta-glucosidase
MSLTIQRYPYDDESEDDKAAAQRRLEFWIGWFADPIYFGDYPECMKKQLGSRLPKFTAEEIEMIKGSNDFYGMVR